MDVGITKDGDMIIDSGDTPILNLSEFVAQRAWLILRSKPGDWAQYANKGADIMQYVGYPNIPATKTTVERDVLDELERDTILGNFAIEVEYTPTSASAAVIEIRINLPDGEIVRLRLDMESARHLVESINYYQHSENSQGI